MHLTGEDHLERAQTELGDPELFFRISRARFLTKLSLGVILLGFGAVANYLWWVVGPARFDHFIFHLLYLAPLSGAALLLHMYRNRGLYALMYPTGLLRLRHGEVVSFPWAEIDNVRLHLQRSHGPEFTRDPDGTLLACWLPVEVPTFKLGDAGVTVAREDGVEAHFGPALTDYATLAEEVQKRTFVALWPRLFARFLDGECLSFGEIEAGPVGLRCADKMLPWRQVKELVVAQGKLGVKQTGKWPPWALVDAGGVPNPHLLFALADEVSRMRFQLTSEPKERVGGQPRTEEY